MSLFHTFYAYVSIGFGHVMPLGFDHILFILCLFFANASWRSLIIQCSIFTLAHSISLALSALDIIKTDSNIIEPLITVTIFLTAVQNIVADEISKKRLLMIILFGLVHGLGFASALKQNNVAEHTFFAALFGFNAGVEIAQALIVTLCYVTIGKWFSQKSWYRKKLVYPVSVVMACTALYWTMLRLNLFLY